MIQTAGGTALTPAWPTVCGFVSCKRWAAPLSHSRFRLSRTLRSRTKPSQSRHPPQTSRLSQISSNPTPLS